jgi:hypothetical protein
VRITERQPVRADDVQWALADHPPRCRTAGRVPSASRRTITYT